jgi:hypothetical protein
VDVPSPWSVPSCTNPFFGAGLDGCEFTDVAVPEFVLVDVWAFAPTANAAMIMNTTSDRIFIDEALLPFGYWIAKELL